MEEKARRKGLKTATPQFSCNVFSFLVRNVIDGQSVPCPILKQTSAFFWVWKPTSSQYSPYFKLSSVYTFNILTKMSRRQTTFRLSPFFFACLICTFMDWYHKNVENSICNKKNDDFLRGFFECKNHVEYSLISCNPFLVDMKGNGNLVSTSFFRNLKMWAAKIRIEKEQKPNTICTKFNEIKIKMW